MDAFLTKILLATDGSEDAALAMRAAVEISEGSGAQLHVVHAWRSVPSIHFEAFLRVQFKQEAQEVLDGQVEQIKGAGFVLAGAHLREGAPVDEILSLAEELGTDLVVMGSRGRGTLQRLLMGSVSEGVVHGATFPVLVMRGGEQAWPPQRVLIGDDGSEEAKGAGELAARIGKLFDAKARVVQTYPWLPEMDTQEREFDARMVDDELRRAEQALKRRVEHIEKASGLRPRIEIATGDPAAVLLRAASDDATERALIAVGSRGISPMQRLRLGSVSTKVLHVAEGPVLVYPSPRS